MILSCDVMLMKSTYGYAICTVDVMSMAAQASLLNNLICSTVYNYSLNIIFYHMLVIIGYVYILSRTLIELDMVDFSQIKFVYPLPDRLVCKICSDPYCNPQLSTCCRQIFCESDLTRMRQAINVEYRCPTCQSDKFHAYWQPEAEQEISALWVYCPNK